MRGLRAAAVLLLSGLAGAAACARQGFPPGGPPDDRPPRIVATVPDTFAVVEPGGGSIEIHFSERISERPVEGPLRDAVIVSPATGEARVEHTRSGLEVDLQGGFRPGTVYRVTVLPVIQDMFQNRMQDAYEFVFSTGPSFEEGVIAGAVDDRITAEPAVGARVEAVRTGGAGADGAPPDAPDADADPAPHVTFADSSGIFALRYLPSGSYRLRAWEDRNRDRERGFPEPADSLRVTLGPAGGAPAGSADTAVVELRLLPGDTTAPVLARAETAGPGSVHLLFDDALPAEDPGAGVEVRVTRGEEGPAVPVAAVVPVGPYRAYLDSLEAAGAPDTVLVGADDAEADTLRPATDTARARAEAAAASRRRIPPNADSALPGPHLWVILGRELEPGVEYRVVVRGVRNVQGVGGGGGEGAVVRPASAEREPAAEGEPGPEGPPDGSAGPDAADAATPTSPEPPEGP